MQPQKFRCNRFASRKNIELIQIDDGVGDAKKIVKPPLGHTAMQGHLAAFESATAGIAATRFLAFVSGAGGFASFEPIPRPTRTLRWREPFGGRKLDKLTGGRPPEAGLLAARAGFAVDFLDAFFCFVFFFSAITYSTTSTRCRTLRIMPRIAGVS